MRTAPDLFAESLRLLLAKDMTGYADLWATDGRIEFPFAPPGYPPLLDGRAAITDYLRGYPDLLDVQEITEQTVHVTANPDVVVGEFTSAGAVVATGRPFQMRYVAILTAHNGEITHYRDYWNPLAAAEFLGGTLTAFTGAK